MSEETFERQPDVANPDVQTVEALSGTKGISGSIGKVDGMLASARRAAEVADALESRRVDVVKIARLAGTSPIVESLNRQVEQSQRMQAEWAEREAQMRADLAEATEARELEAAAKLERELESLRLAGQLVDQQQVLISHQAALVAEQRDQAKHTRVTRRLEVAVLVVSVLALIVAITSLL